jgi:hypothetical protein
MTAADVVATRAELDALLANTEEYLEDFEEVSVHGGTSLPVPNPFNYVTGAPLWSSMLPGVTYSSAGSLVIYGGFLWGDDSNILQGISDVLINFDVPQVAVGFDLDGVANAIYHQAVTYYHGTTVIGAREFDMAPGATLFIGWQDPVGMTSVHVETSATGFTARAEIDNVAWGLDAPVCTGDLTDNGATNLPDGTVNVSDLFVLLANWNTSGPGANLAAPTNIVNVADLFALLAAWGNCP